LDDNYEAWWAIRGSNTIEGYTVEVVDAEAVVAGEEMPNRHDRHTQDAVTGYVDALTYVLQAARFEVIRSPRPDWGSGRSRPSTPRLARRVPAGRPMPVTRD